MDEAKEIVQQYHDGLITFEEAKTKLFDMVWCGDLWASTADILVRDMQRGD